MAATIPYPVIRLNIKIPKGATYKGLDFVYYQPDGKPYDLTGFSASLQFRLKATDPDPPLYEAFSGGDIFLGTTGGEIRLTIPAEVSSAWTFTCCVYDMKLVDPVGEVNRLLKGFVTATEEVTRT